MQPWKVLLNRFSEGTATIASRTRNRSVCQVAAGWATFSLTIGMGAIGIGVACEILAPAAVHAYTSRLDVTLEVQPNETFNILLRRAEAVARAAAQRSFDRDILVTDVSVTVIAQREGNIVPLLTLQANRNQWRDRPDPRPWSTYFRNAQLLLRMDGTTQPAQAGTPAIPANVAPTNGIPTSVPTRPATPTSPAAPTNPAGSGGQPGFEPSPPEGIPADPPERRDD